MMLDPKQTDYMRHGLNFFSPPRVNGSLGNGVDSRPDTWGDTHRKNREDSTWCRPII